MKSTKQIADILNVYAREHADDCVSNYHKWIDWMAKGLSAYPIGTDIIEVMSAMREDNEAYYNAFALWVQFNVDDFNSGKVSDYLGTIYEENYQSNGKASSLGQFYTPMCIGDIIAAVSLQDYPAGEVVKINDCSCGSGRLPMEVWNLLDHKKNPYALFYLGDIDSISVHMSALNMLISGMVGFVSRQDALTQEWYSGYVVNRIKIPYLNNFVSLEYFENREDFERVKARTEELARSTEPVTNVTKVDKEVLKVEGVQPAAPAKKTSGQPIQLSLF